MTTSANHLRGSPVVPSDSLAAGIIRAEASTQSLRDVAALREAANALVDAATAIGCYNLVAVNAAAEPLTTAAALMSDGRLACSDSQHSTAEKVLIVDAATVTGDSTRSCASYLRENGAAWIGAIIFDRVRPDMDGLDDEPALDFLTALRQH
jgi:hypothetical protein